MAIDVNSGKTTGDNVEDMAFKTNMEAAEEAARQLRLRDLAGLVVIDFIDMKREGNNRAVMERLVDCLKEDKARMEVGKINRFGVLVMTRQRLRPSLQHVTHETCPTCQGTGKVKSIEALVLSVVRRIKAILSRDAIAEIRVKLMPAMALAVLNQKRKDLTNLEDVYDSRIVILADPEIPFGEMAAEIERAEEGEAEKAPARAARERHVEPEDETVVLGGDTPISFEKALGEEGPQVRGRPAAQPRRARTHRGRDQVRPPGRPARRPGRAGAPAGPVRERQAAGRVEGRPWRRGRAPPAARRTGAPAGGPQRAGAKPAERRRRPGPGRRRTGRGPGPGRAAGPGGPVAPRRPRWRRPAPEPRADPAHRRPGGGPAHPFAPAPADGRRRQGAAPAEPAGSPRPEPEKRQAAAAPPEAPDGGPPKPAAGRVQARR